LIFERLRFLMDFCFFIAANACVLGKIKKEKGAKR